MINCYACGVEITLRNNSIEHVIPNSLGGKIKCKDILCKSCNNHFGKTIDTSLFNILQPFLDILDIKRDRKKENKTVKLISKDDKVKLVSTNLQPLPSIKITFPEKDEVEFFAKNETDLLKQKDKKKKELEASGKYSRIIESSEEIKDDTEFFFQNSFSKKPGQIGFGGKDYFRAMAKIAVNFALYSKIDKNYISNELISFIKGDISLSQWSSFYYPNFYKIHKEKENEISHLLHLRGDPKDKSLYVYIELLNSECVAILLNDDYQGCDLSHSYCYDLLESVDIEKKIKLKLRGNDIKLLKYYSEKYRNEHENKHNALIQKINSLQDI